MLLSLEPDVAVIGEAANGPAAVALAEQLRPDVVLMDIVMPEGDGIDAAAALRSVRPEVAVVILTLYDNPQNRERARAAGVAAFLGKHVEPEVLLSTIRQIR